MYLGVILAELKADDWLASDVDIDSTEVPKMSVATGIELQCVMSTTSGASPEACQWTPVLPTKQWSA